MCSMNTKTDLLAGGSEARSPSSDSTVSTHRAVRAASDLRSAQCAVRTVTAHRVPESPTRRVGDILILTPHRVLSDGSTARKPPSKSPGVQRLRAQSPRLSTINPVAPAAHIRNHLPEPRAQDQLDQVSRASTSSRSPWSNGIPQPTAAVEARWSARRTRTRSTR